MTTHPGAGPSVVTTPRDSVCVIWSVMRLKISAIECGYSFLGSFGPWKERVVHRVLGGACFDGTPGDSCPGSVKF